MSTHSRNLEAVRLANMALAEVGEPQNVVMVPTAYGPAAEWPGVIDRLGRRAVLLAKAHMVGMDFLTPCPAHEHSSLWADCPKVTIAEALLGVVCHRAASGSTGGDA